ncbi:crossover junction endodeoxyribonuclease RuvC [Lentisphaerota bacterium WC36G]|nr:crossover junction endodeoxyribonuclease RuvC [Lentisphaerae bacterium WC36]
MIILGIDPAIRCTGYSVIEVKNVSSIRILDCGVIKNKPKDLHSECLRRLSGGINELVHHFSPDYASLEEAFYGKNIKTSMVLSLARGAIIARLAEHGVSCYQYSPKTAKKSITGSGRGSKEQIATLIASIYNLNINDVPLDATDAIALGICHANFYFSLGPENLTEYLI